MDLAVTMPALQVGVSFKEHKPSVLASFQMPILFCKPLSPKPDLPAWVIQILMKLAELRADLLDGDVAVGTALLSLLKGHKIRLEFLRSCRKTFFLKCGRLLHCLDLLEMAQPVSTGAVTGSDPFATAPSPPLSSGNAANSFDSSTYGQQQGPSSGSYGQPYPAQGKCCTSSFLKRSFSKLAG